MTDGLRVSRPSWTNERRTRPTPCLVQRASSTSSQTATSCSRSSNKVASRKPRRSFGLCL